MRKKITARKAYTTYHPDSGLNPYWVRSEAGMVRAAINARPGGGWERFQKGGWKIVRIKIVPDFKPPR